MRISEDKRKKVISNNGLNIAIVASQFNGKVVDNLVKGAKAALSDAGMEKPKIIYVPGAFEIPVAIKKLLISDYSLDGIIALGCVIKGDTAHFEYVAGPVSYSLNRLSVDYGMPIGFGVLACYTPEQAYERSKVRPMNAGTNKGYEAAVTVLEMIDVLDKLRIKL